MKISILVFLLSLSLSAFSQNDSIPFPPSGYIYYPEGSQYKGDTALFNLADGRSGYYVSSKRLYAMNDSNGRIQEQGAPMKSGFDRFVRGGKWTTYYGDHSVKMQGEYYRGRPVGNWQVFYPNKKLQAEYLYALISDVHFPFIHHGTWLSGPYREYFPNGQLKLSGYYAAVIDTNFSDTTEVYNPETDTTRLEIKKASGYKSIKIDTWYHYNEKGEMIKEENFD